MSRGAIIMTLFGAVILGTQPELDLSLWSLFQWGEIFSLLVLVSVLCGYPSLNIKYSLGMATVLGICPAIHLVTTLYEARASLIHFLPYCLLCGAVILLLVICVRMEDSLESLDRTINKICLSVGMSYVTILILDFMFRDNKQSLMSFPGLKGMMGASLAVSVILKFLSVKKSPESLPVTLASSKDIPLPRTPMFGNIFTIFTFLLLCLLGPSEGLLYDLWCCGASLVLLCLQRDFVTFTNLRPENQATPTIVGALAVLLLASVYRSNIWSPEGNWMIIRCILELTSIVVTVPVYIVLWGILWWREVLDDKAVVFTLPFNAVLILAASSYSAWVLGACGLFSAAWMMMYKLPMVPYEVEMAHR